MSVLLVVARRRVHRQDAPACRRRGGARPRRGRARRRGTGVSSQGARQSRIVLLGAHAVVRLELAARRRRTRSPGRWPARACGSCGGAGSARRRRAAARRPRAGRGRPTRPPPRPRPAGRTNGASDARTRVIARRQRARTARRARRPSAWYEARPAMEIIFVTTELAPFVKVGGLADVVGRAAQGAARARAHGHHRHAALPGARGAGAAPGAAPHAAAVHARATAPSRRRCFDGRLASQVDLVVVDVPGPLRPRRRLRRAAARTTRTTRCASRSSRAPRRSSCASASPAGAPFDVVHCNDWPTALVPDVPARARGARRRRSRATRTVLTIHNVAHQGVFPQGRAARRSASGWDALHRRRHRVLRRHQPAQAGHRHGRRRHDGEPHVRARDPDAGARARSSTACSRARGEALVGIVNGVDYAVWNPATDPAIAARYDAEDFAEQGALQGRAAEGARAAASTPQAPLVA